ncbi:flagellar basal body-associated protein FliL [Roseinatronobacter sp. S2]|uniref:flagellar basal body-associated FliL family protein n=1 Tax=Roseinatronobacter sp. S2 TaxID=3035471 RepID=UPI002410120E|nr:flagellar basal body-associated FliL family protein [Roseinatronobacter sp. S2]WFE73201.1 flagellar basal body-associated FliL family protein [Roseinatronobacter sp. S2]
MTTATDTPASDGTDPSRKSRRGPIIIGLTGALLLGGGAFFAVYSGMILAPSEQGKKSAAIAQDFAFIPIERITISLAPGSTSRHLQFAGQIEVEATSRTEIERLQPRFIDVINMYLRAVDPRDLAEPASLIRLRAQILRRLQTVAGQGHIRDFLITEFVLS